VKRPPRSTWRIDCFLFLASHSPGRPITPSDEEEARDSQRAAPHNRVPGAISTSRPVSSSFLGLGAPG
jgi:hypothetical protein